MNELIAKIEQWAEDRNIIKGSKPIDQAMKLFSEFGELADNVGKGRDCKDDIGDVFVVLTIMAKQEGLRIDLALTFSGISVGSLKHGVAGLGFCLSEFINSPKQGALIDCIECLDAVCYEAGVKLEECVQIAYNDIKDRKGLMHNGVFIKESDPAYALVVAAIESNCTIDEDALDNIEVDKRMATQKRISVNLEDL